MENNQYLSMFIDESQEHLQAINDNFMKLEQDPSNINIVNDIFRSAHTLKGMSATMGFEDLASLTHEMENVLYLVRDRKLSMNNYIFDVMFKGVDSLEKMVQDIVGGGTGKADVREVLKSLKGILAGNINGPGASAASAEPVKAAAADQSLDEVKVNEFEIGVMKNSIEAGYAVFFAEVAVRDNCMLKAARAYMVFNELERNGEIIHSHPTVQDIEAEKFEKYFSVYYLTKSDAAGVEKMIMSISEIDAARVVTLDTNGLGTLETGDYSAIVRGGGKKAEEVALQTATNSESPKIAEVVTPKAAAGGGGQAVQSRTIRVDVERLDALMNLFSELLIDRVRLEQLAQKIGNNDLNETVEHMTRITSDLQNVVMKLRMVPVDTVFQRFPRMVRDLAKSLDKKVDLIVSGADTEVDKTVVEELGDPLVHMLRNAVDHGLETLSERKKVGKSETGIIHLRAFNAGNDVFIEIEEDGRGINPERVLSKAVQKGLVSPDQAKKMTKDEIHQLIFASGFSTAEAITDVSGRGVGLDVVKSKITGIGGDVIVDSVMGKGTKFIIRLPLTLSIIPAMLIKAGSETYAIPLSSIVETFVVEKKNIRTVHGTPMVDYRKSVIPIIFLSKLFDLPDFNEEDEDETELAVIRKGDKLVALSVDDFIAQQEIVIKTLGEYLEGDTFAIMGATILGNGQTALIIDTNALIK